jgi:hypothetical protein
VLLVAVMATVMVTLGDGVCECAGGCSGECECEGLCQLPIAGARGSFGENINAHNQKTNFINSSF